MGVLTMDGEAIVVRDVVRCFGPRTVLHGINLTVRAGEIHALLGPNGAGKTTLTRILAGLTEPHSGEVLRSGTVGFVPSGDRTLYNRISGLENLIFFGRMNGLRLRPARARALGMLEQVGLSEAANRPVGKYSHGMQKRLSVARALLVEPAVLLVDEATHDLDPEGARRIRELVDGLAGRGVAVVWTTQRIEEIRNFADTVSFIRDGKVRFAGSVGELIDRAPEARYVVRVRNGHPERPPEATTLQSVLAGLAEISRSPAGVDQFFLAPAADRPLGSAVAALDVAGYSVLNCQRDGADIEDAFLALARGGAE